MFTEIITGWFSQEAAVELNATLTTVVKSELIVASVVYANRVFQMLGSEITSQATKDFLATTVGVPSANIWNVMVSQVLYCFGHLRTVVAECACYDRTIFLCFSFRIILFQHELPRA